MTALANYTSGEQSFSGITYIEFNENTEAPRGNHYHASKELHVLKGRLRAITKTIPAKLGFNWKR
jgi:hypothetical protein